MPDTFTANYNLTKPEVGASTDTWGGKLNANLHLDENLSEIDARMKDTADKAAQAAEFGLPAGVVIMWAGSVGSIPAGWTLCDGTNGAPDLRDRFIIGAGGAHGIGATGGSSTTSSNGGHVHSTQAAGSHNHGGATTSHALSLPQTPPHNHGGGGHDHPVNTFQGGFDGALADRSLFSSVDYSEGQVSTVNSGTVANSEGSGQGHSHGVSLDGIHAHSVDSVSGHTHTLGPPYYALAYLMRV